MIHDTKAVESNKMVSYLRGEQGWGQQVRDMDGDWWTSPVTLGKHVEAGGSQGHHCQLPGEGRIRYTLHLMDRNTGGMKIISKIEIISLWF